MMNARQYFAMANHFDNEKFEKCINIYIFSFKKLFNKLIFPSEYKISLRCRFNRY